MSGVRQEVRSAWLALIKKLSLKAFVQVTVASDVKTAYQVLVSCAGLGGLDTNTVVVPLFDSQRRHRGTTTPNKSASSSVSGSLTSPPAPAMKARTGSYYENVALMLKSVEPMSTPNQSDRHEISMPRANAMSDVRQWVGILKDTLLLNRNVVVETNFEQMREDTTLPLKKRFLRGPQNKAEAKYVYSSCVCLAVAKNSI